MDHIRTLRQSILARTRFVARAAAVCLALITSASYAQDSNRQTNDHDAVARKLVQQLGAASLQERDQATRDLAALGMSAEAALRVGMDSKDAEIRDRCLMILRDLLTTDLQARIKSFKNDLDGTQGYGLPGFEEFVETFDNKPASRELFVRMLETSPGVMGMETDDPQKISIIIERQVDLDVNSGRFFGSPEVVAAVLYASSRDGVRCTGSTLDSIAEFLIPMEYAELAGAGPHAEISRAILNQWLGKYGEQIAATRTIDMCLNYGLRSGLPLVRKYAADSGLVPADRVNAILAVAKLGDKSDIPSLEDLFEAREVARSYTLPNGRWETQLRDVALACVLHLSGEDPRDFGFVNLGRSDMSVFQADTLSFSGERERQMAFAKYYARYGQRGDGE